MTFERLRELEPVRAPPTAPESGDAEEEDAFAALGDEPSEKSGLGKAERAVFALAEPGRTVERIVDLARLGEFETCKALLTLSNLNYLRPVQPARRAAAEGYARDWRQRARKGATALAATVALAAVLAGIAWIISERGLAPPAGLQDDTAKRFLARYQLGRLRGALEVYRVERGAFPERLGDLVETGLAEERDLRYPWSEPYHYRRTDTGYVLLPPLE
jgi:hypothetical protein